MTGKIFLKLIFGIFGILVVALVAVDFLASRVAESAYLQTLTRELADKGRMLAALSDGKTLEQRFQALGRASGTRLTLIAQDGRVIADTEAQAEHMENHATRPEIMAALAGHEGSSTRPSPTMGVKFLYVAIPVPSGALRLAVPLSAVDAQVNAIRRQMLASTALAFVPAIILAALFARLVSRRLAKIIEYAAELARGNFKARLEPIGRDELGLLGGRLNETGQKLQEMFQKLEKEHAELEKLERVRKDFVINVSHELRTPLASIQGYTETLLDGALHDEQHNVRFLSIIRQNADRLRRLTEDLMTLSQIELNRRKFNAAMHYVNTLLADAIDFVQPMADKKGIAISMEPAAKETEVYCDAEAVHQILSNLLDNGLKYTPDGGSIMIGARSAGQDFVEIYVQDTGIGIPPEELPRLFERFYRVDKARSRELGGTGLGLAIVKHLVRAQGGDIRVESGVNQGSTFAFTLPNRESMTVRGGKVQQVLTVS